MTWKIQRSGSTYWAPVPEEGLIEKTDYRSSPEDVVVAPGIVAARVLVELVGAGVVLDNVASGSLLDVHALVGVGRNGVPAHDVVVRLVLAVCPLFIL